MELAGRRRTGAGGLTLRRECPGLGGEVTSCADPLRTLAPASFGTYAQAMPAAKSPLPPIAPWPISDAEAAFIKETVERIFGADAVVRNFGSNPAELDLHIETSTTSGLKLDDCKGYLWCRIERPISLIATERGTRVHGAAKIAYRQGVIL